MKSVFLKVLFLIITISAFTFIGCSKPKSGTAENTETTKIMASFYPLYIMLLNITEGAEDIELSMLAPADTGCLHDYQLTTRDMKNLEKCTILVLNGSGMEDFTEKAFQSKNKDFIITASEGFPLIEDNAHIWVSISGCIYEVEKITEGLSLLDEKNADIYRKNAETYIEKVKATGQYMHSKLDPYAGTSIITFHEAFPYFAEEFNLPVASSIEREPGTEPGARELNRLIQTIKLVQEQGKKTALFAEPQYSASAASVISYETGLTVGELDPSVTGKIYKDAWLDAMKNNADMAEKLFN